MQALRKGFEMIEIVLPAIAFLMPALSIFLMYLHERCKENMIALYADMRKVCELPDDHTTISEDDILKAVSLDAKETTTIKGTPPIESFGEPWFDLPKFQSSISSTDYPPGSSHRSHRTNCCNCAQTTYR